MSSLKEELEAFGAIRAGYQQAKAMELLLKRCVKRDLYMSKETYVSKKTYVCQKMLKSLGSAPKKVCVLVRECINVCVYGHDCEYAWTRTHTCVCVYVCMRV